MRDGRKRAILFDLDADVYRVVHSGDDGLLYNEDDVTEKTVTLADYGQVSFGIGDGVGARPGDTVPENGAVSFSHDRVQFNPDGTGKDDADEPDKAIIDLGSVYIKNDKGQTFAVGSTNATGRVKAWVDYGQGWED